MDTERSHDNEVDLIFDCLSIRIGEQELHSKHTIIDYITLGLCFSQHVFLNYDKSFDLELGL